MKVINICNKSKKTMAVARNVSGQLKDVILLSRALCGRAVHVCLSVRHIRVFI